MPDPRRLLIEEAGEDLVFEVLNPVVVVGRDASADLTLEDPQVSKRHCEIRLTGDRLIVRDLGSTNGTFVNGMQVSNAELKAGDVVGIGDHVLHVDRRGKAAGGTTAAASKATAPGRTNDGPMPRQSPVTVPSQSAFSAPPIGGGIPPARTPDVGTLPPSEAPTAPRPVPRRSFGSAGILVALALLLAGGGAVAYKLRSDGKEPVVDRRASEGRQRLDAITALAETRGRRAALTELDAIEAMGVAELKPEIARLRAAVLAAYADVADNSTQPVAAGTPVAAPTPNAPAESADTGTTPDETPSDITQFTTAVKAGRFLDAWRLAEDSPQYASLSRQLETALSAEKDKLAAEFAGRKTSGGDAAARQWLGDHLAKIPVGSRAYGDLQALILAGTSVAKASAGAGDSSRPSKPGEAEAPKDVPAGEALKSRLTSAEEILAKGDLTHAATLLNELSAAATEGNHRALLADVERALRAVHSEEGLRIAIARAVGEGAHPETPTADGVLMLTAADEQGVLFARDGKQTPVPWRLVPVATLQAIAERLPFTPGERVHAAAVLFRLGKDASAVKLLVRGDAKASDDERRRRDQVLADARRMPLPSEGFRLVDDRFLSPTEFKRFELNAAVEGHKADLGNRDDAKRRAAFEALAKLGPDAKSSFHAALLARRAGIDEALKKDPAHRKLVGLRDKRAQIDSMRKELLELIFDETNYPYPYRPPQASQAQFAAYQKQQALIDGKTPVLKQAWKDAEAVALGAPYREKLAQLAECDAWLIEAEAPETAPLPGFYTLLPAENEPVTVRSIAVDAAERGQLDASVAIMQKNGFHETASKGEIEQCRLTNEYRLMLGRRAVIHYGLLIAASRGHCQDMSRYGFFAHESPVPGKRSPGDRMKLAGVDPRGGGENIAVSGGPQGAFEGWRRSSGHHRNMIEKGWRYLGVGNDGRNWCQLFISGDGNLKRDPPPDDEGSK